jgi:hypothetical protein
VPILGGFVRFREHQWGYQGSNSTLISTPVAAVRSMPLSGTPDVNRNATFSENDQGSVDPISAPYFGALEITETLTGDDLDYDSLPWYISASIKSGTTPTGGGSAKTWTQQSDSLTRPVAGYITEEFGDDVTVDWYQFFGGIAESLEISGEGNGALAINLGMRFAGFKSTGSTAYPVSGTVPTTGLTVAADPPRIFLADGELFIDDAAAGIGTTKISDALTSFNFSVNNTIDPKFAANGSNTRFQPFDLPIASREVTLRLQFHKTSATVGTGSESDDWMASTPTKRFVELRFTRPSPFITGSTPYSWSLRVPLYYTTREEVDANGNTQIALTGRVVYDNTLTYAIRSVTVNALATPSPL